MGSHIPEPLSSPIQVEHLQCRSKILGHSDATKPDSFPVADGRVLMKDMFKLIQSSITFESVFSAIFPHESTWCYHRHSCQHTDVFAPSSPSYNDSHCPIRMQHRRCHMCITLLWSQHQTCVVDRFSAQNWQFKFCSTPYNVQPLAFHASPPTACLVSDTGKTCLLLFQRHALVCNLP